MRTIVENRRDRLALAEDAGWGRISAVSVLAGLLVGYGAFAILAGIAAAVFAALDVKVDLSGDDLSRAGTTGGIVLGVVLFGSYLVGGYVAGRMARRAGATHGILVFVFGLLLAIGVAAVVEASGSTDGVIEGLRNLGIPTTGDQWRDIFTVAGLASLAGMLLGSVLGGVLGERWHTKLVARALDPTVGPEADYAAARSKVIRAEERREIVLTADECAAPSPANEQDAEKATEKARSRSRPPRRRTTKAAKPENEKAGRPASAATKQSRGRGG